jgi:heme-degrading monooxygenase HmoA
MFARLTTVQIKLNRIDEFIKRYEESVVPAAKTQKGYCGVYLFVDRKTGNGVALSLWDKEEDALANEQNLYYQEQVAKFITFFKKNPIREGYEVCVKA